MSCVMRIKMKKFGGEKESKMELNTSAIQKSNR